MRLTFLGAAREVTGSCYLLEAAGLRGIIDCGMFHGDRNAEAANRMYPGFDPQTLDFVLLTHAHIDHSGLLPRLVAKGFRGPVYCTRATRDLLEVMLPDSAHIQEKEAEWANCDQHKMRKAHAHERAPLYTVTQAHEALKLLRGVSYDRMVRPHPGVRVCFRDAGHILGSAIVELWLTQDGGETKLVFSGDLGMPARPVVNDPTPIETADVLLVESTYGNRLHKGMEETRDELVHAIGDTLLRKKGNVIIPAFAVGRTQELLFLLMDLVRSRRLPRNLSVFVDSPMANAATEITLKHRGLLDEETVELLRWFRSSPDAPYLRMTESVEDSMALNRISAGAIILSASGMCDAGRIKHHLRHNLPRRESSIVIAGFQAAGTLGRQLVDSVPSVRLFRETVPVRADIYTLGGLSAHADRDALLRWLAHFRVPPRRTFVVHGEEETALGFARLLQTRLGWQVVVPERGQCEHLRE
ncbi:MAG TPA: MBL fold metallo-hydrolase [Thiobacillaceae bacterium]|nr:MBL fold metallo-hydrolase [Thiobacillaceae bacterium]HNU63378.1 MBL fold metallo-hydrolase [Thiobacillaceae bacterium]